MKQLSISHKATILALGTAFISGVSIFINKFAVTSISDPVLFSGFKNAIVAVFLVGIILAFKKRNEVRTLTKRQWKRLGLIGLIGGSLPFALFFAGLAMIPAVHATMIHKTLFIWVALLAAVFLRERLNPLQWLGVASLFAANIVIFGFSGFTGSTGEYMILGATLFWATENIIAKKALVDISSTIVASARMVFGSAFLLLFLTLTGRIAGLMDLTLASFAWTLLTALFLLGYVLTWYTALKYAPASYVAALLVPATLVTNVLSAIFVTGTLTEAQVLSGFLMILGAALMVLFTKHTATTLGDTTLQQPPVLR